MSTRIINEDTPDVPTENFDGYINDQIAYYMKTKHRNEELWDDFRLDFAKWLNEDFNKISQRTRGILRSFLRDNGIYISKTDTVAEGLSKLLDAREPAEWPDKELSKIIAAGGFNSRRNPDLPGSYAYLRKVEQETKTTQFPSSNRTSNSSDSKPQPILKLKSEIHESNKLRDDVQTTLGLTPAVQGNAEQSTSNLQQYSSGGSSQGSSYGVQTLHKIYQKEDKYSGAEDVLDKKLRIFYDLCYKANVDPPDYPRAFATMLTGEARDYYFNKISGRRATLAEMVQAIRDYFETEQRQERKTTEWEDTRLEDYKAKHPEKSLLECFDIMRDQLVNNQAILRPELQTDAIIRDKLYRACRDVRECNMALFRRSPTFQGASEDIRNSLAIQSRTVIQGAFATNLDTPVNSETFYTDRKYKGRSTRYNDQSRSSTKPTSVKKCFVCKQLGCWSTNHSDDERKRSFQRFKSAKWDESRVRQYIIEYEGLDPDSSKDYEQFINEVELEDNDDLDLPSNHFSRIYTTEAFGDVDGEQVIQELERQSIMHVFYNSYHFDPELELNSPTEVNAFLSSRYPSGVFMGIMIDTGAANRSTAGYGQFTALQKALSVELDRSRAGEANVQFGIGKTTSLGTADVITPIGKVVFHVVSADTPFLLSLKELDDLGVKFDNLENVLIQGSKRIPIVRAYGHPWMLLNEAKALTYLNPGPQNANTDACHLTEVELRRLHRRFGHPSTQRFHKVLERAGHETNYEELNQLTKFCKQCQMHRKPPGRFKFTLKDDCDFNHTLFVDVLTLDDGPVLHIVDEATNFQGGRFLNNMSAKHTWDTLRQAWIDTYFGPPAYVAHDPGTNFNAQEFRDNARLMNTEVLMKPVEAHHSLGRVERYHIQLRRVYKIISEEDSSLSKEMKLQMALKALNDTVGPNGLVPTVLVFGAYPRMASSDAPAASTAVRAATMKKAMVEARRCMAARKVADALNTRNGPLTAHIETLPLNSEVVVYREGRGWQGPFNLVGMDSQTCQVNIDGRAVNFRSTVVQPYQKNEEPNGDLDQPGTVCQHDRRVNPPENHVPEPAPQQLRRSQRKPHPRYSGYEPTISASVNDNFFVSSFNHITKGMEFIQVEAFLSEKENRDREISLELRRKGIITTPGKPFILSRRKEMDGLLSQGVYELVCRDDEELRDRRIFGSRMVDEVKGKETAVPYEKSRLVIQAYNDHGKKEILTQSPTIQRVSQRIIVAMAPSLSSRGISIFLRDITQAYVQSNTRLARPVYATPPKEMCDEFLPQDILKILKPLYGIPESGTHWYGTYHDHHETNLEMENSTYDPCLLITKDQDAPFGIVGMQTDDTLILGDNKFVEKEGHELKKAKLNAKPIKKLTHDNPLLFNGCKLIDKNGDGLGLIQNGQGKRLNQINPDSDDFKQIYLKQRARGAYIASICQPEAAFDCSVAAQHQSPGKEEVNALNKRLEWQMKNLDRGLHYIPLDLGSAKLFVFVDGSFANNHDLSSQIGYVIVLGNEAPGIGEFRLKANILHWSSTKCKRVTRAVLASELYGMVAGIDMAISISTTLNMITKQLKINPIPVVVCTDSFSLYECMVKLGTTKEKRLMIDIMAIRQSYERRELSEIRWITGDSNPADSMTKSSSNGALKNLVSTNKLDVKVQGWVQREASVRLNN